MAYLVAAVVLVGAIATVNLLLTVGVVRRLREHTAELAARRDDPAGPAGLPVGAPVGEFAATGVSGRPVTRAMLDRPALVGFFSPGCAPCKEKLPDFVAQAARRPGGPDAVLAVVVGDPAEAAESVAALRPVATVVVEPEDGPLQWAFAIGGFPTFVLVEDGVVAASDDVLPPAGREAAPVPAAG